MNVLFDLVHPADVNFFSKTINRLLSEGHSVTCIVLKRGNLPKIVQKEFPKTKIIIVGKHRPKIFGKIFGMFQRELFFIKLYLTKKFDVVFGFGFYAGMFSWIRGIKSVHIHDDKEYKTIFFLSKLFARKFISLCPSKGRTVMEVHSYKELAYLSPKYFQSDDKVLSKLKIKPKKYIYVREVANISVNYAGSKRIDYSLLFDYCKENNLKIIFDPEGESKYKDVSLLKGVFTLEEHNSIKNNAALIVTSGDTVLREGALLGVPTIYTSQRNMAINEVLLKKGLFSIAYSGDELLSLGKLMLKKDFLLKQKTKAKKFVSSCSDINEILYKEVLN